MKRAGPLSPWATHWNGLGRPLTTLMPGSYPKAFYLIDLGWPQAFPGGSNIQPEPGAAAQGQGKAGPCLQLVTPTAAHSL